MSHEDFAEKVVGIVGVMVFIAIAIVGLIACTFCGIWLIREIMGLL